MSLEANFWEAKRYMRVVQRINDGATLCDELINMAKERFVSSKTTMKIDSNTSSGPFL